MAQPSWTAEETLIALDVYMDNRASLPGKGDPQVKDLSKTLRKLATSKGLSIDADYRNDSACFTKLRQFQFLDVPPKGLKSASKLDRELFARYVADPSGLKAARSIAQSGRPAPDDRIAAHLAGSLYSQATLAKTKDAVLKNASTPALAKESIVRPAVMAVGTLLMQEAPFRIPRYQRAYSWTEDELADFTRDIRELATYVAQGRSEAQHFFGGFVVVRGEDPAIWDVIDGQQRLTTFLLALSQVRSGFEYIQLRATASGDTKTAGVAASNAKEIEEHLIWYLRTDPLTGVQTKKPRLIPTRDDEPVFEAILRGDSIAPTRASHELLGEARTFLWRELVAPLLADPSGTDDDRRRALLATQYALLSSSVVIQLKAQDVQAAYRLFMVLNDRGMQLSEGDLLRASSLDAVESFSKASEGIATAWDSILSNGAETVQGFLRSYYPSVRGERADVHNLVDEYRQYIFGLSTGRVASASEADELKSRISAMANEMNLYVLLMQGSWPFESPTIKRAYQVRVWRLLRTLRHDLAIPLLLASARFQSEADFGQLVITLERFAFRWKNVCGGHPDAAARAYYRYAKEIRESGQGGPTPDFAQFLDELRALVAQDADDPTFLTRITKLTYDRAGQRNNIKWLLAALEDFRRWLDKTGTKSELPELETVLVLDIDATQLDHIYPQAPDKPIAALDAVKHHLGNIALLKSQDNSIARNSLLKDKRKAYFAQKLEETSWVAQRKTWTENAIDKRQKRLIARVTEVTRI